MKHTIISLALLFLLASCQEKTSKEQKQAAKGKVNTELSENIENETIFLGLRFGMGGEETHNYFRELANQGKLQLLPHEYLSDKGKIYIYKFEFGDEDFHLQNVLGTFKTHYINDKLYKLRISVESEKDTSIQQLKSKLKETYVLKYGANYIERESIYNSSERYEWNNGNMTIEIAEGLSNNILIIYTDLRALKEKKTERKETLMREI